MSEVKWIKITTSMFDDEKIRIIESMPDADSILVIWIKLLTLGGKVNSNGFIFLTENIPYTDEMLSNLFNRPLNTVRLALSTFKQFGMVEYDEANFLHITNWSKHQNIEGLDKIREQNKIRQQRHRETRKALPEVKKSKKSNVTVTLSNAIELDIDKKENKNLYGEFVLLTDKEHQTLTAQFKDDLPRMIEILDNYLGQNEKNRKRYTSHIHVLRGWVKNRMAEEKDKAPKLNHVKTFSNTSGSGARIYDGR
jgi:predicted phage replisome organizer